MIFALSEITSSIPILLLTEANYSRLRNITTGRKRNKKSAYVLRDI